jgi:hypothetical protein
MKMIAHQTVGADLRVGLPAGLAQSPKELFAIFVILEDALALVPAIDDVIHRPPQRLVAVFRFLNL